MPEPGPFERHVREAIALNCQRRAGYVRAGGSRAALVSRLLVGSERALLPLARRQDAQAAAADCDPVWASVFAPMSSAPPQSRPVRGAVSAALACERAAGEAARPLALAKRALGRGGALEAAAALDDALGRVEGAAHAGDVHLAMTRHLLESARLASVRALGPCAGPLASFARWHLRGFRFALTLDALAAPLHARGVGILANDLPPIPTP